MGELSKQEMLDRVRKQILEKKGGKFKADPTEWKAPNVKEGEEKNYKFIILPPLQKGNAVYTEAGPGTGKCSFDMDTLYYYQAGRHWIDRRPHECPRIHDSVDCPICKIGFDLLSETDPNDKKLRSAIAKQYLSRPSQVINVYFLDVQSNPEDVRGKVMWISVTQKDIWERFTECINRDEKQATGETPEEAKAWGLFYLPDQSYVFNLNIKLKNDYNDYGDSKFLPSTRGWIVTKGPNKEPDTEKIKLILNSRHDLAAKFSARNIQQLQELANKLISGDANKSSNSNAGFDSDEKPAVKSEASETKPASTPAVSVKATTAVATAPAKQEIDPELQKMIDEMTS